MTRNKRNAHVARKVRVTQRRFVCVIFLDVCFRAFVMALYFPSLEFELVILLPIVKPTGSLLYPVL